MTALYRRSAAALGAIALIALAGGLLVGPATGWALAAVGVLVMLAYHIVHLARLARWVADPRPGKVPEGSGTWDDVLTALHRYERGAVARETDLAAELGQLRRAAQALPDGVVLLDAKYAIEWCNDQAAAMLGLDARADVGRPIVNLVREPRFIDYLAAHDDSVAPLTIGMLHGRLLSIQLIPYGEAQTLLLARDITQAERVETMRRDFVANVSHELRTPLTVLVGFLETVRELKLDPQRVRDYVGMMRDQAARMHRIIEDLLALSTLESAPPPAAERVRVAPLLERLAGDATALSGGRHEIVVQGTPRVDLVGAETEIGSAFGNLVSNAVRYTPAGGRVTLSWHDGHEGASFTVTDTGVGVAAEHIPRLTERFYRVDRSRSRETGGTGLGLAIVKHALARHQAYLEIESTPGAGSRFTARFPAGRTLALDTSAAASASGQDRPTP